MLRAIQLTALGGLLALLAAVTPALAQGDKSKLDRVYYLDPGTKKEADAYGKIDEETPAGVKLKVREGKVDKVTAIPAEAITRVYYYTPEVTAIEFNGGSVTEGNWERASGKKKGELLTTALAKYAAVEKQVAGRPEAKRYIQYRIAMLHARVAKDEPAKADEAIRQLKAYADGNRGGWQVVPALTTLARMLEEAGRVDEARSAYETLASLGDAPPALVRQSQLSVGKLSLRAGKWAEARKQLEKLAGGLSGADPEKPFADAYLAESKIGQGQLEGADRALQNVLKVSGDARLRGLAHNLLGDWNERRGQLDEAFWHYLRVDALYAEDPEEHARALFRLAELYDKVKKDPVRGRDCARRLMGAGFDGTRYQKRGKAAGMKADEGGM
ncbi:MAG: tetratricopeptide repeat protein [Gemmataceae bacterium]